MLRNYELHFSVGQIDCILMDIGTDLHIKEHRYYQHCHPGFELHYIFDGYFEITGEKKKLRVSAGQLVLVPPGVYHYVTEVSENARRMTMSMDMRLPAHDKYQSHDEQFYKTFSREHIVCLPVSGTVVEEDLRRIYELTCDFDRSYLSVEKLRALSSLLLVNLCQALSADTQLNMQTELPIRAVQEFFIDAFMGQYFMQNDASSALAKELNVSQRQLHRIMKKAYGMNYREKLKQIRMEIAMDFLVNTDKSIGQIAEILGYSSGANFSAFVKRETGKTPLQIRKEER